MAGMATLAGWVQSRRRCLPRAQQDPSCSEVGRTPRRVRSRWLWACWWVLGGGTPPSWLSHAGLVLHWSFRGDSATIIDFAVEVLLFAHTTFLKAM